MRRLWGLVLSGPMDRTCLMDLPRLPERLGPVVAGSYSVASRYVNRLRAGTPEREWAELAPCTSVLISVPDRILPEVLAKLLALPVDWPGKAVLLCGSRLDSSRLRPLAERGAVTASLMSAAPGLYVAEGQARALQDVRLIAGGGEAQLIELLPGEKPAFLAGLSFAACLLIPVVDSAVAGFRQSGLPVNAAVRLAVEICERALRSYAHAGRKSWTPPRPAEDFPGLAESHPGLAGQYAALAQIALAWMRRLP